MLIRKLIEAGASVAAYDPAALETIKEVVEPAWLEEGGLQLMPYQYDALKSADAMVLVTEWKRFRSPDFEAMKELLNQPVIFDGRNQYDPEYMTEMGFAYYGIGRGNVSA